MLFCLDNAKSWTRARPFSRRDFSAAGAKVGGGVVGKFQSDLEVSKVTYGSADRASAEYRGRARASERKEDEEEVGLEGSRRGS